MFQFGDELQAGHSYSSPEVPMAQYRKGTLSKSPVHGKSLGTTQVLTDGKYDIKG